MNTEHLNYILEISKCQSISQASKNLFIGQSTLSNIINTVENELGAKLFFRTNKGIRLTEVGEQILPELKELLLHQNNICEIASNRQNKKTCAHIAVYPAGASSIMVNLLGTISQLHPQSTLHFIEVKPESIIKKMLYNGSSIGLGALSEIRYQTIRSEADHADFSCKDIYRDPFYLYVGKHHPLANESCIDLTLLVNEPIVLMRALITPGENVFYSDFQKLNHVTTFDNYESIKKVIAQYKFATIAPSLAFYNDIYCNSGEIIQIPLTGLNEILVTFLITPKKTTYLTPLEHDIIAEIEKFFN